MTAGNVIAYTRRLFRWKTGSASCSVAPTYADKCMKDNAMHPAATTPFLSFHPWFDGNADLISAGATARVILSPSGHARKVVRKGSPDIDINHEELEIEHAIYQLLGQHPRLIRMIEYDAEDGLTLEYMPNGTLRNYLRNAGEYIYQVQRRQWIADAVEAVAFLHSKGVLHGDIKPENFLLDSSFRLRIIDFAGSSTATRRAFSIEGIRFFLPRDPEGPSSVHSDLFALGSTMYEIVTGRQPYEDKEDEEVETLYKHQEFPHTDNLLYGDIIRRL